MTKFLFFILNVFVCLFTTAVAATFPEWQGSHFTPAQLSNTAISGPLANPDGDIFSNLQEYAFALEPFTANSTHEALGLSLANPATDGLLFTYAQSKTASDLLYQIEYTDDLTNNLWNLLTNPQEPSTPLDLGQVWQRSILVPLHFPKREFLRLRLHQQTNANQPIVLNDPPQQLLVKIHEPFVDVDMAWIDRSNQESGYRIERHASNTSTWTHAGTTTYDTRSFRDQHLAGDTLYYYRVRAVLYDGSFATASAEVTIRSPLDSDGDNLPDWFETKIGTSATNPDSDNDGLNDGYEIVSGTRSYGYADVGNGQPEISSQPIEDENGNPTGGYTPGTPGDPWFDPNNDDSDGNGINDGEEDWDLDAAGNPAPDGLTNAEEYAIDTDPLDPDTDNDDQSDGEEAAPLDKFITLPRVPESHYAVLPIQEITNAPAKVLVNDTGATVWQQTAGPASRVDFWRPSDPAPLPITVPDSTVELKDFAPDGTVLLKFTLNTPPYSANTEYPLEQKCRTGSATWTPTTGAQAHLSLKGSPLIQTIFQKADPLWQQMLPAHRQNVNDSIQSKQTGIAAQDAVLNSNADAAAKQAAAARKQTLQNQIARSQQHLAGLGAAFDPIALAQETNIIGSGFCSVNPVGFGPGGSIIATYYETLFLESNGDFPFYVKLEHGGLCIGNNGVYSLYDPTSASGSAKPAYLNLTLDGEYRALPGEQRSRIDSPQSVNRHGLVYARDTTNGRKVITGNGLISPLPSAEGLISNTTQAGQPFPFVGVRLDYGESSIYRKENGLWKEWAYGIFNEDHPAWISDRLEMLLTDTPSIWRNGRAVELAGLVSNPAWESLMPLAIGPTSGMIYASASKTQNPDGTPIPPPQRKTYAVSLLPVEFVETTPALKDETGADIPNSTKPKSLPLINDMVEEPRTGQTPNVAYRILKVKVPKEMMAGEKVKWSMMPQFTPGGASEPKFRGQWPTDHPDRFEAAPTTAYGFERISQTEGRTTVDSEGYFAVRINLPPIGYNKARVKLEFEKYPGAYSEIDFEVPAVVVIDPGHGGTDNLPGSSANNATSPTGIKEKDLALSYGLALRDALKAKVQQDKLNAKVLMTRTIDENVAGTDRAHFARDNGADAVFVIHFNASAAPHSARGTLEVRQLPSQVNLDEDIALIDPIISSIVTAITPLDAGANKRSSVATDTSVAFDPKLGNTTAYHPIRVGYCEVEFLDNAAVDVLLNTGPNAGAAKTAIIGAMRDGILNDLKNQPAAP